MTEKNLINAVVPHNIDKAREHARALYEGAKANAKGRIIDSIEAAQKRVRLRHGAASALKHTATARPAIAGYVIALFEKLGANSKRLTLTAAYAIRDIGMYVQGQEDRAFAALTLLASKRRDRYTHECTLRGIRDLGMRFPLLAERALPVLVKHKAPEDWIDAMTFKHKFYIKRKGDSEYMMGGPSHMTYGAFDNAVAAVIKEGGPAARLMTLRDFGGYRLVRMDAKMKTALEAAIPGIRLAPCNNDYMKLSAEWEKARLAHLQAQAKTSGRARKELEDFVKERGIVLKP